MVVNYEKTKQIWDEFSDAEKEEIVLQIDELVEQNMIDDYGLRGAVFPVVMRDAEKIGINSDMFFFVMQKLSGVRYAYTDLCIHYLEEFNIHHETIFVNDPHAFTCEKAPF